MTRKKKDRFLGDLAAIIVCILSFLLAGQKAVLQTEIEDVRAGALAGGTYTGSFEGCRWSSTLEVTVKDGRIDKIAIIKDRAVPSWDKTAAFFDAVIEKQTPAVDAMGAVVKFQNRNSFCKRCL